MSNQQAGNAASERQPASMPPPGRNPHLDRVAGLCQVLAIVLSALAAFAWLLVLPPFQGILPGYAPPAVSLSLSLLILSLVVFGITHRILARHERVLSLAAVSLAVVLSLTSVGDLAAGRPMGLDSILAHLLYPGQASPGIPVSAGAAFLPLLAAAAELLLLRPAAGPGTRNSAAGLGGVVMVIGATICLGHVFSAPILYGGRDLGVTLVTGATLFFLGGSLIATAGPGTFLTSSVVGNSLQARLLRVFLPLAAGIALAQSLFHFFMSSLIPDHAFAVAISAVSFLFVTGITVILAGRSIGLELDAALDQRQRAETAARLTAAKYQSLFDVESDALFLIDQETGSILEANAAASNLYGYSHQELLTMHHLDLAARPDQTRAAVEEPGSARPVRHHRTRDGSVIPVEIVSSQLEWDGRQVRLVATRDVADRQLAQQALRDSETRFRAIFGHSVDAISVSVAGLHRYVNAAFLRLFGFGPGDEIAGRPILESIAPSQRDAVAAITLARAHGEPAPSGYETKGECVDGSEFDAEIHVATFDLGGETYTMAVIRDVTERKRAEEQMALSLKEKEILLREIHHRVKNNLQVIASLVTLQANAVQDPTVLQVLRETQSRIRAMSLIHAKLYQSRDLAQVDFGSFVRDLGVVLLRAYLADPSRVTLEVAAGDIRLHIDSVTPCGLIVNELLANCVRHAFPDGRPGRIRVDMSLESELFTLRVADNGVGFPASLDFRNTTSLGLQLVNLLAEQLGGSVEMNRGEGTEFTITFPSPDRAAEHSPAS